jgi:hypothetical protein
MNGTGLSVNKSGFGLRLRGWKGIGIVAGGAALLAFAGASGYRNYGPTPWRTVRLYVQAVNANDFDAQYALFVRGELKNPQARPMPLLPKEEFRRLLAGVAPPTPNGLKLRAGAIEALADLKADDVISGVLVPVIDAGRPKVPRGPRTNTYCVALQKTREGWRIRPVMTYWMNYSRFYGDAAAQKLITAYQQRTEQIGLSSTEGGEAAAREGTYQQNASRFR